MRITIFGATGKTGTQLVTQALDSGHHVTAVVRDPARLAMPRQAALSVVIADVTNAADILPAVDGADVVISAIGPQGNEITTIYQDAATGITQAMEKVNTTRLLWTSGSMVSDAGDGFVMRNVGKPLTRRFMSNVADGMAKAEVIVHAVSLDWTIVRPPRLVDKPATGHIQVGVERNVGLSMTRSDVAAYHLSILDDPSTFRKNIFIAN